MTEEEIIIIFMVIILIIQFLKEPHEMIIKENLHKTKIQKVMSINALDAG